ncbi:MAG: TonB-dependent receptor, partial [Phascolarctobacterium sp.]|nr:TonB-dependent receptor [Phascolarctobacterium sp.]
KWNADLFMRAGSGASPDKYVDSNYITVYCAITYKATNDLSFYAKGYNLFNEAYADCSGVSNGSYIYPAQSRRFIVGAEYKF